MQAEANPGRFGAASELAPVTDADRRLVRDLVKGLVTVADEFTHAAIGGWPREGSLAEQHLNTSWNAMPEPSKSPVRDAHASLLFANFSGTEHARAFLNNVNSKRFSFSLATLTRGALEAFAKSYFLMSTNDAGELVSRRVSLSVQELSSSKTQRQKRKK